MKIEFRWRQIFEILIIHKPSLGSLKRRTEKPNLYIDDKRIMKNIFMTKVLSLV